tara:strand:+ start:104 stop:376 length:273 start_codon:yes stop_codon:yes gene_type:complete
MFNPNIFTAAGVAAVIFAILSFINIFYLKIGIRDSDDTGNKQYIKAAFINTVFVFLSSMASLYAFKMYEGVIKTNGTINQPVVLTDNPNF